ncbi:Retron-type reverse transcriptase [Klebsiella pneumoniae]|nr:Retron-type reverse transcriptase [Klebsiella pneumoniae]SSM99230.1 Retron-type reverse transcriptase [Klebsiella pneumoniae]SXH71472.1 Retron-type reverse transcriptase [Klebsiella pneumoniae]SXI84701.1 Retron-type reverse transcriptase [Klebsiella pneumoniae]SYE01652.1 Retron-type reverse transcriptase [Klebsiella pneumoniae]
MQWISLASECDVPMMKNAAKTIKKRLYGILNAMRHRVSNGNAEALNSKIRLLRIKARGYRNRERFKLGVIVAAKLANNPQGAESVERRSGAKGNAEQPHMRRTQSRESMSQRLSRVREAAKQRKKERFTALFHLLTAEALENAFLSLSRKAAAGVDGVRWKDYAENLKVNIADLHRRLHQGSYRAQAGRRHYIPKADGKQRPLGIASLEDKIVQYALVKILNAVYENDFMGFSYGFRPG